MKRRNMTLALHFLLVSGGALFFVLGGANTAHAAPDYPGEWCKFSQTSATSIEAECTDDQDNGGYDGKVFKSSSPQSDKYTLTETSSGTVKTVNTVGGETWSGSKLSCSATITSGRTGQASISGKYLRVAERTFSAVAGSTTFTYECSDLKEGDITLDRTSIITDIWVSTMMDETSKDLEGKCRGNPDAISNCKSQVRNAVGACMGTGTPAYGMLDGLSDGGKQDYIDEAAKCLKNKLGSLLGLSQDQFKQILQGNKQTADTAAGNVDNSTGDTTDNGTSEPSCEAGEWGWVFCPAIQIVNDIATWTQQFLDSYLRTPSLTLNGGDLYEGWGNVRSIANALLIVGFLFVIFSQSTSYSMSAYGVKKMLPRLLAAAVLINLSYIICAILVDISNILGANVSEIITGAGGGQGLQSGDGLFTSVIDITLWIISGFITTVALVVIAFFMFIPILVAMLSVIFVLAARTAIITLLIFISPLAFAAWILPNTEKWFRKWWDIFLQMLVVYPAVMALFAASSVAANLIINGNPSQGRAENENSFFAMLMALIVQALPILALPSLIKMTSGIMGKLHGLTMQRMGGDFMNDKVNKAWRDRLNTITKEKQADLGKKFGAGYTAKGGKDNKLGRFKRGLQTGMGRGLGWVANAPLRKQEWAERKDVAESEFKTRYQEAKDAQVKDGTGRLSVIANKQYEQSERARLSEAEAREARTRRITSDEQEAENIARSGTQPLSDDEIKKRTTRVMTQAMSEEKQASDKRVGEISLYHQLKQTDIGKRDYTDENGVHHDFEPGSLRHAFYEAYKDRDFEAMSGILQQTNAMGAGGTQAAAEMLDGLEFNDSDGDKDLKDKMSNLVTVEMFDKNIGKNARISKGGFSEVDDGQGGKVFKFSLGSISQASTAAAATQSFETLMSVDDKGVQGIRTMTKEQAQAIIQSPQLDSQISSEHARAAIFLRSQGYTELPDDLLDTYRKPADWDTTHPGVKFKGSPPPAMYLPPRKTPSKRR